MELLQLKNEFTEAISPQYPTEEVQSFFFLLSEKYLKMTRLKIALQPDLEIAENEAELFKNALLRLKKYEPIQYILGDTEFYGLPFLVNKHTLIPRPETEELVEWIISEFRFHPITIGTNFRILDIGTGSGCIAVSLAKNLPNSKVSALDISEEALKIAKENAKINEVEIDFLEMDILQIESLSEKYEVIVSNPPYVRESEKGKMHPNVLDYEPAVALFVKDEDALVFYRAIAQLSKTALNPGGSLYFEINEYLGKELKRFLTAEGFGNIIIKKDIFGKERMLKCDFNE